MPAANLVGMPIFLSVVSENIRQWQRYDVFIFQTDTMAIVAAHLSLPKDCRTQEQRAYERSEGNLIIGTDFGPLHFI